MIGALRHRVTLEVPLDTSDAIGGFTRSYAPLVQLWAKIEPIVAKSDFVETREEQATTHRVTLRWRGDVKQAMRFDCHGRKLLIQSLVDPDERRRFLVCGCEEISP